MTSPWNAYQWVNCNGSVMMQALYPTPEESDSQREGKAVHHIVELMLKSWKDASKSCPTMVDLVGLEAPNGVVIDENMAQAAIDYVTDVMMYCNATGTLSLLNIEESLDLSHIGPNMTEGRPDVYVWNPDKLEIFVSDLKYGHTVVEAVNNDVLVCYVAGIIEKYDITGLADQVVTVRARIFQPRASHPDGPSRTWTFYASDIRGHINRIESASNLAYSDVVTCKSGDWCSTCTARHSCNTLAKNVYAAMDYASAPTPFDLNGASLVAEHLLLERAEKLIKARKSAIDEQCKAQMQRGVNLPGLAVQQGYGFRKWKSGVQLDEIITMAELLGVDINKPREIDTPAQVEKKGIDREVIELYTYKPKTSLKIVKDDGAKARQVFRKQ